MKTFIFIFTTLIAFLYEFFLALPFIGGATVIASGYMTITIAIILHLIVAVGRVFSGRSKAVPLIAIVLTLLTWIPGVGWLMHIIITVMYFVDLVVGLLTKPNEKNG